MVIYSVFGRLTEDCFQRHGSVYESTKLSLEEEGVSGIRIGQSFKCHLATDDRRVPRGFRSPMTQVSE